MDTRMLAQLFGDEPFAFRMRFRRGELENFYRNREGKKLLDLRAQILAQHKSRALAFLPEGAPLLSEMIEVGKRMRFLPEGLVEEEDSGDTLGRVGKMLEPDFLLLKPDLRDQYRLVAGAVCFPSHWDLREKVGKGIELIHGVVPGLNESIGPQINTFLSRLKPGVSWERSNWGLSRSADLDQHPEKRIVGLDDKVTLSEIYLRVEEQSLTSLPISGGVLFGIRVFSVPLAELRTRVPLREGLVKALETMPEEVAKYKGIASSRKRIRALLLE